MRLYMIAWTGLVFIGVSALAMANPAMLPKHPGYPSSGEFANDTGQPNLTYKQSIQEAAKSGDTYMAPSLIEPNNARLLEHHDVDRLPIVEGATSKIESPMKEGSRMPTKR